MSRQDQGWLREGRHTPAEVAQVYDTWAANYDRDLADWEYRAPALTVDRLAATQADAAPVLDVGCGTGLVGRRLQAAGFAEVLGIDLSARSIELAGETGAYRDLRQVDLQASPIPWDDDTFAALVCVGVMTYLPDTEAVVAEFCRVVEPEGSVLFTQREDLWGERRCQAALEAVVAAGRCRIEDVSEPQPYLPSSEELADVPARLTHLRVVA